MHKNRTGWVILVCVLLLSGACSDDVPDSEPETKKETAAKQPDLPVREWYPTPKHAKPRIAVSPVQSPTQMPMTQQPTFTAKPAPQQSWNRAPQQYVAPQQYPYVNPYQYNQRPWGNVPDSKSYKQPDPSQNSWQPGTEYWGTPGYGGGQYYVYPAPGMPGHVW